MEKMIIAVTSQNKKSITQHAGRCRRFWIFKVDDGKVISKELLELEKDEVFHGYPPTADHPLDFIDVLIAGSLGQGLVNRLAAKGIKAMATKETDIDKAIEQFLDGSLEPQPVHSHHGHDHRGH